MSSNKSAAKTITVNDKLEGKEADYVPIGIEYLQKHPSAALTAVVNMLNCHMADMFITMLAIVGDKYDHTIDDMIETVKADPRWDSVQAHPLVKSLSYFDQRDADTDARTVGQKAPSDMPVEKLQEATNTTAIKKMRLKKAATAEEPAAAAAPAVPAEPSTSVDVAAAKPAKKTTKKATVEPAEVIATTATHAELESYSGTVEDAPVKPTKKTAKKVAAPTDEPTTAEEAATTAPAKPVKKTAKKAAIAEPVEDATVEITEQMKTMAVSTASAPSPIKKTVPKKTATK